MTGTENGFHRSAGQEKNTMPRVFRKGLPGMRNKNGPKRELGFYEVEKI